MWNQARARLVTVLFATAIGLSASGCRSKDEETRAARGASSADGANPATTAGVCVAAGESNGRYRLYRVLAAEELPAPMGARLHLIIYEETAPDLDEAAKLARKP